MTHPLDSVSELGAGEGTADGAGDGEGWGSSAAGEDSTDQVQTQPVVSAAALPVSPDFLIMESQRMVTYEQTISCPVQSWIVIHPPETHSIDIS